MSQSVNRGSTPVNWEWTQAWNHREGGLERMRRHGRCSRLSRMRAAYATCFLVLTGCFATEVDPPVLARIDAAALRDPSAGSGGAPGGLDAAGGATTRDGGATDSGTDAARVDARGMADDGGRDLDRDGPAASR